VPAHRKAAFPPCESIRPSLHELVNPLPEEPLPPSCQDVYSPQMSDKKPTPSERIDALVGRMETAEKALGLFHKKTKLELLREHWQVTAGLALGVIAILVAYFAWLQPQWSAHATRDLGTQIDQQIDSKLTEPLKKLSGQGETLSKITGQLGEISAYLQILVQSQMKRVSQLPASDFVNSLPEVKTMLDVAKTNHVRTTPQTANAIRERILGVNPQAPAYWETAAAFINYRTPEPSIPMPNCLDLPTQQKIQEGDQIVVKDHVATATMHGPWVWKDCRIEIDSTNAQIRNLQQLQMGDLELRHCWIVYRGGLLLFPKPGGTLRFVDCVFQISVTAAPPSNGRKLLDGLLSANNLNDVKVSISGG